MRRHGIRCSTRGFSAGSCPLCLIGRRRRQKLRVGEPQPQNHRSTRVAPTHSINEDDHALIISTRPGTIAPMARCRTRLLMAERAGRPLRT
jgi:hypothetical protein